jgi:hypothetical protein
MTAVASLCADCKAVRRTKRRPRGERCRACIARALHRRRTPESYARAAEKLRLRLSCPVEHAKHCERVRAGTRAALQRPDMMAQRRELGRRVGKSGTGHQRFAAGSPERVAAGKAQSRTKMAWCPLEYRAAYRDMVDSKRLPAAEAREAIEAQMATDAARYARTGELQAAQLTGRSRQQADVAVSGRSRSQANVAVAA